MYCRDYLDNNMPILSRSLMKNPFDTPSPKEVFLDLSTKDMDGLKMQTALRMKKNAAEKRCDYYSDKNTKVMMIEKKNYWFVCNEVETGAQLVIF